MDYLALTHSRTKFLRYFYAEASAPFIETRRKIDAHEPPFQYPPCYEDSEPPFLHEWIQNQDALSLLGEAVASMASEALHLYVRAWITDLIERAGEEQLRSAGPGLPSDSIYRAANKKGWFNGCRAYCKALDVDWALAPTDVDVLEQLVLARNAAQHPTDLRSIRSRQPEGDGLKFPSNFFADAGDMIAYPRQNASSFFWHPPRLDVTAGRLSAALDQIDAFCTWLGDQHPLNP